MAANQCDFALDMFLKKVLIVIIHQLFYQIYKVTDFRGCFVNYLEFGKKKIHVYIPAVGSDVGRSDSMVAIDIR